MNNVSKTPHPQTAELPAIPPALPSVSIPKNENNDIAKRVDDAAKPIFKEYPCWKKFIDFFKRIGLWFKEIPSKISDAFSSCFKSEDDEYQADESDDDDEDDYLEDENIFEPIQPKENVKNEFIEYVRKNLDPAFLKSLFGKIEDQAQLITANVSVMKFKTEKDLEDFDKIRFQILEHLLQISDLKQLINAPEVQEGIKKLAFPELDKLFNRLDAARQKLEEKYKAKREDIEKLRDDIRFLKNNGKNQFQRPIISEAKYEDLRNQEVAKARDVPPAFQNKSNNCWFHAVLQILIKLGPKFHQLVLEKENQRAELQEEFNKNKRAYDLAKMDFDQQMIVYRGEMKKVKIYIKEQEKYIAEKKIFDDNELRRIEEHERAVLEYKEELEFWNASDKTKAKPVEPAPLVEKAPPVKPNEVVAPEEPLEPLKPINPVQFLDTLKNFSEAIQFGDRQKIRRVSDDLHRAVVNYHLGFREFGVQHDAPEFIDVILGFLSKPILKIGAVREGKPGTAYEGYRQVTPPEDHNILHLPLEPKANVNFQDVLEDYFKKKEIHDPRNAIRMKNQEEKEELIPIYSEKQQIDENQNPPDFMFVQLKRYRDPTAAELALERASVENKCKELITKYALKLKKENPDVYRDKEIKDIEAEAAEELKKQKKLPAYRANYRPRKVDTPVQFPENHRINFSKAFGKENYAADYDYELTGTVIQHGNVGGGHYVANVLGNNTKNGQPQWYHTDDIGAKVIPMNQAQALASNKNGYVYLFRKVNRQAN